MIAALSWLFLITGLPSIHSSFCTRLVDFEHGIALFGFGLVVMLVADLRKVLIQRFPESFIARLAY